VDRIYLDYAASTPLDERVLQEMLPYFNLNYGNPSSMHYFGQKAEGAVELARERIKNALNAKNYDVIFTSGGTESDNLALRGAALFERNKKGANRILISGVEHHAVLTTAEQLGDQYGFKIEILRVDKLGKVGIPNLLSSIDKDVALVSIIYANNEIGTINEVNEIGKICHKEGIPFHSDGVQAVAHLEMDLDASEIDLLSIGAHKFYGPKGVGVFLKKHSVGIIPQLTGGNQENGFRSGTLNVPSILGMAKALELVVENREKESNRLVLLRDRLIEGVLKEIPDSCLTGSPVDRLPNHASFVFNGVNGNDLLIALDVAGFAVSSGSACKVGNPKPSDVLLAIGLQPELAMGSLRVTMGRSTTEKDIVGFLTILPKVIETLRKSRQV
jgi:cysteine desulfurase